MGGKKLGLAICTKVLTERDRGRLEEEAHRAEAGRPEVQAVPGRNGNGPRGLKVRRQEEAETTSSLNTGKEHERTEPDRQGGGLGAAGRDRRYNGGPWAGVGDGREGTEPPPAFQEGNGSSW